MAEFSIEDEVMESGAESMEEEELLGKFAKLDMMD